MVLRAEPSLCYRLGIVKSSAQHCRIPPEPCCPHAACTPPRPRSRHQRPGEPHSPKRDIKTELNRYTKWSFEFSLQNKQKTGWGRNEEKETNLYKRVYSASCLGDQPVLLFELFLRVGRVKQVPRETAPARNASCLAKNSHQSLHRVQVHLAPLYSLGYAVHQIVCAVHKEITFIFIIHSRRSGTCILYGH